MPAPPVQPAREPEEESQSGPPLEPGADRQTGIRGRIGERPSQRPQGGAPVLARGSDGKTRSTITDEQGAFTLYVPPGTYTLRSYASLHHGARMDRVRVHRGGFATVNLLLDPVDLADEVVVQEIEIPYRADTTTAAAQDQLRKESRGIGEGMGAQQMSQQGASDAAAAARRVVGVTVDSNQLVVRGLGGRYVRVFMNGLPLPNTDPDFPSVDLDLFPTAVMDNLTISKVFLPDLPGEFAGGVLDIATVSFPRKFLLNASVSTAYNTQSTFRQRLTYRGGSTDWLGFDDGTRAMPGILDGRRLRIRQGGPFPDLAAVDAAGDQMQNRWNLDRTTGLPQMGLSFSLGNSVPFGNRRRVGYMASLVYDYAIERVSGVSRTKPAITPTGDAQERSRFDLESANASVQLTGIATASLDLGPDHSLTALSMFNRSLDDQTRFRSGINAELDSTAAYQSWQLRFLARTVFLNQLLGDHRNLGGTRARLRWSGFYALGRRDEPDQRVVEYGFIGGLPLRWKPTANRLWSDLAQADFGGTVQLRFPLWTDGWMTIGGRAVLSDRTFGIRRFTYSEHAAASDPTAYLADPETLFGPAGTGTLTRIAEVTRNVDSYVSSQQSYAAFLLLETPVLGPLSLAGGARIEWFAQEVASRSPFADENTMAQSAMNRTDRTDLDVLPGAALKYALSDAMLLRAAYGITLSRPQVRELAPYGYYDFLRDRIISGNPRLDTATIHNADVRWEWFFAEGQIAAISGFHKRFLNPIELQIIDAATLDSQYQNARGATSLGTELELRSELGTLARALRWFSLGGNLSLIRSRIDLEDTGATRTQRPLAGQSPYVANLSLRFSEPVTGLSLGLIYNVVGPRIVDVGGRINELILPDVEEQAFHSLDFVAGWSAGKHLRFRLRARNLLLQRRVLKQGSMVAQELNPGTTFSFSVGYDY